ncbi:MAG TPA: patatin-like phospholipase family protein [Tissierellaceae bacterium]|nr:patatin-like phospholipase family protein [Tissierellaceae bacterium]
MIGLVLEGGGAKGSYHIGVYKAIIDEGIKIDGITGTSIGSVNGAMIVQGDFELCHNLWERVSYSMVINASDQEIKELQGMKLNRDDLRSLIEKLKIVIGDGGIDITPFKELLDTYIDEERIRNSPIDFGLVTVNLTDFKSHEVFKEDIPYGQLKDYILASAYLPVFKHEKLGGKIYLDGAFYDNLPFKMLQNKGYEKLILVRTHGRGLTRRIDKDNDNITVITPSDDIGETFIIDADVSRRNMKLGYYDALRAFRALKGRKFYILPREDKDYFLHLLLSLEDEKIDRLKDLMRISETIPNRRALFESIIPRLGSILSLSKDFTYEDLLIALLENMAKDLNIERFAIYSFEEFRSIVKSSEVIAPVNENEVELSPIERIIERVDLASIFNREEVLLKISDIIFDF